MKQKMQNGKFTQNSIEEIDFEKFSRCYIKFDLDKQVDDLMRNYL